MATSRWRFRHKSLSCMDDSCGTRMRQLVVFLSKIPRTFQIPKLLQRSLSQQMQGNDPMTFGKVTFKWCTTWYLIFKWLSFFHLSVYFSYFVCLSVCLLMQHVGPPCDIGCSTEMTLSLLICLSLEMCFDGSILLYPHCYLVIFFNTSSPCLIRNEQLSRIQ